jgi:hypothetical protein
LRGKADGNEQDKIFPDQDIPPTVRVADPLRRRSATVLSTIGGSASRHCAIEGFIILLGTKLK